MNNPPPQLTASRVPMPTTLSPQKPAFFKAQTCNFDRFDLPKPPTHPFSIHSSQPSTRRRLDTLPEHGFEKRFMPTKGEATKIHPRET